jgi:Ca2+-binding RTX toxin-like protein
MLDVVFGDTIILESDYRNESANITQNGLTFYGEAGSVGIALHLAAGIGMLTLTGAAPIEVFASGTGGSILGNAGANVITVTDGVDAVDGGPGVDRLIVDYRLATGAVTGDSTSHVTEAGGTRSVTITAGTIENFTILTGAAADTLTTANGDDIIAAGAGANTITTGDGTKTITTGDDADTITAGNGNDTIHAGAGANTITAGSGANLITSGGGADIITVLGGGNAVDAGDGNNTISTGGGNDTVLSGTGDDTIVLGGGDDLVTLRGGIDTVNAGAGTDRLVVDYAAMSTAVTLALGADAVGAGYSGTVADQAGSSIGFLHVEAFTILGGSGNDLISVGDADATLRGGGGDDTLSGGAGQVTASYSGGRGDYTITYDLAGHPATVTDHRGGSPDGTDTLTGISSLDFANTLPTGTVTIDGLAGWNEVLTTGNTLADADGFGPLHYQWQADGVDIAGATGGSFHITPGQVGKAMTVVISYTDGAGTAESVASAATGAVAGYAETVFQATAAGSRLDGTASRPSNIAVLRGAGGNDTLLGGAGDDRLAGNGGHNVMDGGSGNDQFFTAVSTAEYDIIRGGTGDDILTITLSSAQLARTDVHAALVALNTFETVISGPNPSAHFVGATLHLDMTGVENVQVRLDGMVKTLDAVGAHATGSLDSLWLG